MYQALYRKYRPRTFSEVVGQSHITDTLQRQVAEGRVGHAYLFTGTRGTGKTTCARILAKAVNCQHPVDGAPCCQCDSCRGIDAGTLLDVTELDAASNGSVNDARTLREEAVYPPSVLKKRVYIIDEVHMLSRDAFNALLKIMEEPPEHLLFILATTELHKVPATILSRCQRFSFKRILPRDAEQQLLKIAAAEDIALTSDGAEILARMANGALRDALSLLDQCRAADGDIDSRTVLDTLGLAGSTQTLQLMRCLLARNAADALALFDQLYRSGKDVAALLGELSDLSRDMTVLKAAPEGGAALLSGVYDRKTLTELGRDLPMSRFLYMADTLQSCCAALADSIRPRTAAELCLLRLCDESLSGDLTAFDRRLACLEQAVQQGAIAPQRPSPRQEAPVRPAPAPRPACQPPVMEQPPLPEEPPLPEQAVRDFGLPEEPPVRPGHRNDPPVPASPAAAGDDSVWRRLLDQYKGRLPVNARVMLSMASGVLDGDCLTVLCRDDFTQKQLDKPEILTVLRDVTAAELGRDIRVMLAVGKAPPASGRSAPPPPPSRQAPQPAPQAAAPAPPANDPPPWEPPASTGGDRLDELAQNGRQLDNFKIK